MRGARHRNQRNPIDLRAAGLREPRERRERHGRRLGVVEFLNEVIPSLLEREARIQSVHRGREVGVPNESEPVDVVVANSDAALWRNVGIDTGEGHEETGHGRNLRVDWA